MLCFGWLASMKKKQKSGFFVASSREKKWTFLKSTVRNKFFSVGLPRHWSRFFPNKVRIGSKIFQGVPPINTFSGSPRIKIVKVWICFLAFRILKTTEFAPWSHNCCTIKLERKICDCEVSVVESPKAKFPGNLKLVPKCRNAKCVTELVKFCSWA